MKTTIPTSITTIAQAEAYLTDLYNNDELYNIDDDAVDIFAKGGPATKKEAKHMNKLADQFCALDGFDPHGFCLELLRQDPEYRKAAGLE